MALSILDGNQSATTLSTILTSGQHITAHTVVSLGTQAITDMRGAVSGSVVSISNFPATQPVSIASVTVGNTVTIAGTVTADIIGYNYQEDGTARIPVKWDNNDNNYIPIGPSVDPIPLPISGTVTANLVQEQLLTAFNSFQGSYTAAFPVAIDQTGFGNVPISGTVTASLFDVTDPAQDNGTSGKTVAIKIYDSGGIANGQYNASPVFVGGTVTIGTALPTGTNRIGVVTIGGGTVTIGAGTAQIGSVTASISNSVVTFYPMQGTSVSNTNFTSTTASTTLVSAVAGREVLTVFNEGAGNLHISAGATCTTVAYQVRLSAGDYWECPAGQLSLAHTAVFATAGTARVTEVS